MHLLKQYVCVNADEGMGWSSGDRDASIDDDQSHPIYSVAACSKQKAGQDEERSIILDFFQMYQFIFCAPYVMIDSSFG